MISKREKVEKEREKGTIGKRYGTGTEELGDEAQLGRTEGRKNGRRSNEDKQRAEK